MQGSTSNYYLITRSVDPNFKCRGNGIESGTLKVALGRAYSGALSDLLNSPAFLNKQTNKQWRDCRWKHEAVVNECGGGHDVRAGNPGDGDPSPDVESVVPDHVVEVFAVCDVARTQYNTEGLAEGE